MRDHSEGAVKASVYLKGDAEILAADILNLQQANIQKTVRISVRVKYADKRYHEWYMLPEIFGGEVKAAHEALDYLWRQRAITAEQHRRIEQAIYDSERATANALPCPVF